MCIVLSILAIFNLIKYLRILFWPKINKISPLLIKEIFPNIQTKNLYWRNKINFTSFLTSSTEKKKSYLLAPSKMNRKMLSKMLKSWNERLHISQCICYAGGLKLLPTWECTLKIAWMCSPEVWSDRFIFKAFLCSILPLPDRWQGSAKAKIRAAGTTKNRWHQIHFPVMPTLSSRFSYN